MCFSSYDQVITRKVRVETKPDGTVIRTQETRHEKNINSEMEPMIIEDL